MRVSWSLSIFTGDIIPIYDLDNMLRKLIGKEILGPNREVIGQIVSIDLENDRVYGEIEHAKYSKLLFDSMQDTICSFEIRSENEEED